jgi:hypothetical protein
MAAQGKESIIPHLFRVPKTSLSFPLSLVMKPLLHTFCLLFALITVVEQKFVLAQVQAQTQVTSPMQEFWRYWSDGKAELSHYAVTQSRYGEPRKADVFMIFVTEPFNLNKQVKADAPEANNPAQTTVLKLNRVKKFQTGIYDYSLMTSVFVPLAAYTTDNASFAAGTTIKVAFTCQEWCGTMFHQLNRVKNGVWSRSYSYFEPESDQQQTLMADSTLLLGDELFIAVRELVRPLDNNVSNGRVAQFYTTLERARFSHKPLAASQAGMQRQAVQARWNGKTVEATKWLVSTGDGQWQFVVEKAYPRRILSYQHSDASGIIESGELRTTTRLPYWSLHSLRDESYLKLFKLNRTLPR